MIYLLRLCSSQGNESDDQRKRCLRTDNGREYTLQKFDDYFQVYHTFSCSHNTVHSKMLLRKGRSAKLVEA